MEVSFVVADGDCYFQNDSTTIEHWGDNGNYYPLCYNNLL